MATTIDFTPTAPTNSQAGNGIDFTPINTDGGMSPTESATALGHSNGILEQALSFGENMLPTAGAIAGGIGGAAAGALGGAAIPGADLTGVPEAAGGYAGGVAGSGAGAAAGEALKEKLQGQNLDPGAIATQGGINAGIDAIGGPLLSLGGKALESVAKPVLSTIGKGVSKLGEMFGAKPVAESVEKAVLPPVKLATSRVAATADILTKKELTEVGRVAPSGKVIPSATEKRAGELLAGKTFSNPVKTQGVIANEIATRGKEAETFLEANAKPISNEEDFNAFQSVKNSSEKYMTPAEKSAYEEQTGVFEKILKGQATGDGGYNTANYYKALKEYESQVTANIPKGKDALLVPGGSARIQAAKDVRQVVRDTIGEKNPEFKGKMFDLASLYDSLDNVSSRVADKAKQSTTFGSRHPILRKTATYGAEAVGAGATYEAAKTLGVPLP